MLASSGGGLSEAGAHPRAGAHPHDGQPIVVNTAEDLKNALVPSNAGKRILVRAGTYVVEDSLRVPERSTLQGEGVMLAAGLPVGFADATITRIVALPGIEGDLLTLGNNASLRGLVVEDVPGRIGNVIAVVSTDPGSSTSASIVECEIVNPNGTQPGGPDGPNGGAIAALTLNPAFGSSPAHTGAFVKVTIIGSIVRAAFRAFFAMNFAARSQVEVELAENVVAGTIDAIGGTSRPDAVTEAKTTIVSKQNVYRPAGPTGWIIGGGSSPPFRNPIPAATSQNEIHVDSRDDRIEALGPGVDAFAGRRHNTVAGESSDNQATLELRGLTIQTTGANATDLKLTAARTEAQPSAEFEPGDDNTMDVDIHDSIGSDRPNVYAHVFGPQLSENFGEGNCVKVEGDPRNFAASNTGIQTPPDEFFLN